MTTINRLTAADTLSASDQIPIYSASNGDARRASMTTVLAFVSDSFASPVFQTQYATPTATGFSITINDAAESTWLIINPTAGFAAGTLVLPATANCIDGQEILVNCTQAVTTLTINGNGAIDVLGEPTTLAANAFFRLRYQSSTKIWYRVG